MALKKGIVGNDGVAVSYHRIIGVSMVVHGLISIEVGSYVNESYRNNQKVFEQEQSEGKQTTVTPPYILTRYFIMPYNNSFTISSAYEYLKTLPEFEGAEDVLDDEENVEEEATQ